MGRYYGYSSRVMPIGRRIQIRPEEIGCLVKEKLSEYELVEEHKRRIKKTPGYEQGKPPQLWVLHEIDYIDELELFWGKRWGAQGIGKLKEVLLTCPTMNDVCYHYQDPFHNFPIPTGEPADFETWKEQWQNLVDTYSKEGVMVNILDPPEPALGPYGIVCVGLWAAALLFVINGGAIMWKTGLHPLQTATINVYRKVADALEIPILYTMQGKSVGEIGGCVWLDDHHLICEDGLIMNREGIEQLRPILRMSQVKPVVMHTAGPLDNIQWPAGGTSHPDMIFAVPNLGVAVLYPPMCGYSFIRFLKKIKFNIIEVPPEEYLAGACNMVTVAPGKVICPAGGDRTIKEMEKRGIDVIAIPYDENLRLGIGGNIHCATAKLIRETGPLVKELIDKPLEEMAPDLM